MTQEFNILIVGQSGRLEYEALLFMMSLRDCYYTGNVYIAEPQPGLLWEDADPRMQNTELRALLEELDAKIVPFDSEVFGGTYVYGNKIEALKILPKGEPFVFFDTDTLILDNPANIPFDFNRPSASLRVEPTWPKFEVFGPSLDEMWRAAYAMFDLDLDEAVNPDEPLNYATRYPYYNAGMFYYRCPHEFGQRFLQYALAMRDNAPIELVSQKLNPWLDQAVLPMVIHSFGGGPNALAPGWVDGYSTCHYRALPLLYAKEADEVVAYFEHLVSIHKYKQVFKGYDAYRHLVYQHKGQIIRDMFDRRFLPVEEIVVRKKIRAAKMWFR